MTDWEAEGLLEGLRSEAERAARRELLDRLEAEGCTVDELRRAVDEDRLSLLPIERLLTAEYRYTPAEVVELTGISMDYLKRDFAALGLSLDPHEPRFGEANIEAMRSLRAMMEAGVSERELLGLTRMVGDASAKLADAVLRTFGRLLVQPGDTERDLGLRLVDAAKLFMPALGPMLQIPLESHMVEIIRAEAIGQVEREQGILPGARPVAVCFADMVGFTSLAERLEVDELGDVTEWFWLLAGEVTEPPVRLVKMIGDEAMLASPDAGALIATSLTLIDAAARDDALLPLRAGAAAGPALRRAGDWYGRPVNLASRITSVAPEGALVVSGELRDAAGDSYRWAPAGTREFKGIEGEVDLYRVEGRA